MGLCNWCPWECGVDRQASGGELGRCGAGEDIHVARVALHHWEEPCISGERGSGTIFFSHCNLHCIFCQNHEVSQGGVGGKLTEDALGERMLALQESGAHNINLVSGTHYVLQIRNALLTARSRGLSIPIVWNSGGYDSVRGLGLLEGLVNIYLPDLKYSDDQVAWEYSGAPRYWSTATQAVREMLRQVGPVRIGADGTATGGLIIRHLVLPGHIEQTKDVLDWIRSAMPRGVFASIMAQYFPTYRAVGHPSLGRPLTEEEYQEVVAYLDLIGLEDGWIQELDSAREEYVPAFDLTGV